MVEFDNIPGYMSMSIPDWVVYVVMLIIVSILGVIVWQAYKVDSSLLCVGCYTAMKYGGHSIYNSNTSSVSFSWIIVTFINPF